MLGSETSAGAGDPALRRGKRVAVIGGGVSGLSAAHELVDRGFSVTVFERRAHVGGKASSGQENGLPAEHGFRFFPGFYFHVIDTMKRIPAAGASGSVEEHLMELTASVFADETGRRMTMPLATRTARPSFLSRLRGAWTFRDSMPSASECLYFLGVIARLATTCEQRWKRQLEHQSWFDHVMPGHRAGEHSLKFERLFAIGLTRSFVATRAEEMNARTGGSILLQLLYDSFFGPPIRRAADRALDGPTSSVWIEPWFEHLDERGVNFKLQHAVGGLNVTAGRITGVRHRGLTAEGEELAPDAPEAVSDEFDWYILAVPCEVLKELLVSSPELVREDRDLSRVFSLKTRWMNGIVIGLAGEVTPELPRGHVLCLGSEWALTLVEQSKFWSDQHLTGVLPRWKTLLSVDISDWESPGRGGLPAKWPPTRQELVKDMWEQLASHLPELAPHEPTNYNLDFDIRYDTSTPAGGNIRVARKRTNDEPLLINTPNSWDSRPKATTAFSNLFIAGDFAQTHTNFASMEAANEAARRAVNALLKSVGRSDECAIEPLQDPQVGWFRAPQRAGRWVDSLIFRTKLPVRAPFRLPILAWVLLGLAAKLESMVVKRPPPRPPSAPAQPAP